MRERDRLDAEQAIRTLRSSAETIMRVDGDRDHMNRSDLKCEQTQTAARLMREIADFLKTLRCRHDSAE